MNRYNNMSFFSFYIHNNTICKAREKEKVISQIKPLLFFAFIMLQGVFLNAQNFYSNDNYIKKILNSKCTQTAYTYDEVGNITQKQVTRFPKPEVSESYVGCEGQELTISAKSDYQINWYQAENETNAFQLGEEYKLTPTKSDTLYLQSKDGECASDKVPVIITTNPSPETPSLEFRNDSLVTNTPQAYSYQWFLNDEELFENQEFHLPEQSGSYQVKVSNQYGCEVSSQRITVVLADEDVSFITYPNPSEDGKVNVALNNHEGEVKISVMSLSGSKTNEIQTFDSFTTLDLSALPAGEYLLRVQSNGKDETKKILLK